MFLGKKSPALFLTLIFATAAIACFWFQKQYIDKAAQTYKWPKTTGHIVESRVLYPTGFDGQSIREREYSGKMDIQYQYSVSGRKYNSNRYWVFGTLPVNAELDRIVSEHPVGSETTVYYNPSDASESCLAQGTSNSDPMAVAFWTCGAIFLLGVLVPVIAIERERRYRLLFQSR